MIKYKKKYLTILAGSPRGGPSTWDSLLKYVIHHLDSDLALCYGDKFDLSPPLVEAADYKWVFEEPLDWADYYSKNFNGNWREYFLLGSEDGLSGGIEGHKGSGAIVFGLKNIVISNYLETIKQYEYIIYTRFDQFYTDYHPDIKGKQLWIPSGEDYFGVCDRHAIFPSVYAEDYFNICKYIDSKHSQDHLPEKLNCESVYLKYLEESGLSKKIKRIKRFQFTASESSDSTRWRIAEYKVYFYNDLWMKYPQEFLDSIENKIDNNNFLRVLISNPRLLMNYLYLYLRRKISKIFKFN